VKNRAGESWQMTATSPVRASYNASMPLRPGATMPVRPTIAVAAVIRSGDHVVGCEQALHLVVHSTRFVSNNKYRNVSPIRRERGNQPSFVIRCVTSGYVGALNH